MQKSANFMPCGTILMTVQKSPVYIFVSYLPMFTNGISIGKVLIETNEALSPKPSLEISRPAIRS